MIGLALAVANYEIDIVNFQTKLDPDRIPNAMDDPRNAKDSTNLVRLIILITTILAIVCLIIRHYYKIEWLNKYFQDDQETHIYYQYNEVIIGKGADNIIERKRMINKEFFFEIFILMICPIPYWDRYV
jgi:hypothetical protein